MTYKSKIKLPRYAKAKDISVDLKNKSVKVVLKPENIVLIEGDLHYPIKVEDSIWNIEDGTKLILTLDKAEENIWKTIIKGKIFQ